MGALQHGGILTITGSGFGGKIPAAPLYWGTFDTGQGASGDDLNPSTLSRTMVWDQIRGDLSPSPSDIANQVLRYDVSGSSASGGPLITNNFDSDNLYISLKRFYDFNIVDDQGAAGFNLKTMRLWQNAGPYTGIAMSYQGGDPFGLDTARINAAYTDSTLWMSGQNIVPQTPNEWLNEEYIYHAGSLNVADGQFDYYRNGIKSWDHQFIMRSDARPDQYMRLDFDAVYNGTGPGPLFVYYDDVYIDDSHARVMVSDMPTWQEAQQKVIQIPVDWSEDEIQISLNQGDFAHFGNPSDLRYLYVVNEAGEANINGFPLCGNCGDTPVITHVESDSSPTHGDTLTVRGLNFGSKPQAAPLHWDTVDNQLAYQSLSSGERLPDHHNDANPQAPYYLNHHTHTATYDDSVLRHSYSSAHMFSLGRKMEIGEPMGAGGRTPDASQRALYVDWWYRPSEHPDGYNRIKIQNEKNLFTVGETISVRTNAADPATERFSGTFERYYDSARIILVGKELPSSSQIANTVLVGVSSGNQADYNGTEVAGGSNKFIRLYDNMNGQELRISWTQTQLTWGQSHSVTSCGSHSNTAAWPGTVDEWNHHQMFIDLDAGEISTWVNGVLVHDVSDQDPHFLVASEVVGANCTLTGLPKSFGISVKILGFDSGVSDAYANMETRIDDVYIDNTQQRVVISEQPTWNQAQNHEIQIPSVWSDDEVQFTFQQGALPLATPLYIYVINENGDVNSTGFQLQ